MKRLYFDYHMQIKYTTPVGECHFTIKCIPKDTALQHVENCNIVIEPDNVYSKGTDSFGNKMVYGAVRDEHDYFAYRITGEVLTGLDMSDVVDKPDMVGIYKYPYGLTIPGNKIYQYFEYLKSSMVELKEEKKCSAYEKCIALMHRIHADFKYQKNVTDIYTTAEGALGVGSGVCQDYAHIMITLCRMMGIPARYVAGMMTGEGFSHAWVEILDGERWYAFDPTNDMIVFDSHIKLGVGRDASDCKINRGVLKGGGNQMQTVNVIVKEI